MRVMKKFFDQFLMVLFILCLSFPAFAKNDGGVFTVVKGDVQVIKGPGKKPKKAKVGMKVKSKYTIIAAKDSRAKIVMTDKNVLNISPNSKIELANYQFNPSKNEKNVLINVLYGKVRSKVNQKYDGKKNSFRVKTPSAVAGVRGTDFFVNHRNDTSQVVTFEGEVAVGKGIGASGQIANPVTVSPKEFTVVKSGDSAPKPPSRVPDNVFANLDKESNADTAADTPDDAGSGRDPAGNNGGESEESSDETESEPDSAAESEEGGNEAEAEEGSNDQDDADTGEPKEEAKKEEGNRRNAGPASGPANGPGSDTDSEGDDSSASNEPEGGNATAGPIGSDTEEESEASESDGPAPGSNGPGNVRPDGPESSGPAVVGGNDSAPSAGLVPDLPPPPPPDLAIGADIPGLPPDIAGDIGANLPPEIDNIDQINDTIVNGNTRVIINIQGP